MKCIIIAAGKGSRLKNKAESKPMMPLLGMPLLERVIQEAVLGGIQEFCVVIGHQAEKIKSLCIELSHKIGVSIVTVENDKWENTQNGVSVLCAKNFIKDSPFILLMGDHLLDHSIIQQLLSNPQQDGTVTLMVDRCLNNPLIDIDDVTKVKIADDKIINIGKSITDYNAYDTGIFYCSSKLMDILEKCQKQGKTSLTDSILCLVKERKVQTLNIGNKFWIDVDDPNSATKAEKALLQKLRGKSHDGPVSRYLNRPLSIKLSKWLVNTSITPNQISLAVFFMSLIAALLFAVASYPLLILGGILAQFSSIVDGCDGEVARLKYLSSRYGGWLDAVLDRYSDGLLLFGLTLYAYQQMAGSVLALCVGFSAIMGSFVLSYTADKYDNLMENKIQQGFHFRMGRDIRILLILLFAVMNQVFLGLLIIALVMNFEVIRRLWICRYDPS